MPELARADAAADGRAPPPPDAARLPPVGPRAAPSRAHEPPVFTPLLLERTRTRSPVRFAALCSFAAHALLIAAAVLVPVLLPGTLPQRQLDAIRVLIYDPPPPPPLPLPRGNPLVPRRAERPRPAPKPQQPAPESSEAALEVTLEPQPPEETPPAEPELESSGSETGSALGVPEGMEGGIPGGQVGGVPGGVLGGVVGGRLGGRVVPVRNPDRPPRLLRSVKPQYPQEAFVKKVQGTVVLEILIGEDGRVAEARVVRSIPLLDAAAIVTVQQWLFQPATKGGRPVPTLARAPITFRIY